MIAVGLEQTVEYVHHRQQVREAQAMLEEEFRFNSGATARNSRETDTELEQLWDDLAVIQRARTHTLHPGDNIVFTKPFYTFQTTAWQTIHSSGVSEYMDTKLLADYGILYFDYTFISQLTDKTNGDLQDGVAWLVTSEDQQIETTAQVRDRLASERTAGRQTLFLNHFNHPERLSAAQLDSVELAVSRGIMQERRLQRWLASTQYDQTRFAERHPHS